MKSGVSLCRTEGFSFAGLEYQIECHCGNQPQHGFGWTWPSKCDQKCSGDENQNCGGSDAMSVWAVPSTKLHGLCIYDFPDPDQVLNDKWEGGIENLTTEYCQTKCSGLEFNFMSK